MFKSTAISKVIENYEHMDWCGEIELPDGIDPLMAEVLKALMQATIVIQAKILQGDTAKTCIAAQHIKKGLTCRIEDGKIYNAKSCARSKPRVRKE